MERHYSFVVVGVDDHETVDAAVVVFAFVVVVVVSKVSAAAFVSEVELYLNLDCPLHFLWGNR